MNWFHLLLVDGCNPSAPSSCPLQNGQILAMLMKENDRRRRKQGLNAGRNTQKKKKDASRIKLISRSGRSEGEKGAGGGEGGRGDAPSNEGSRRP